MAVLNISDTIFRIKNSSCYLVKGSRRILLIDPVPEGLAYCRSLSLPFDTVLTSGYAPTEALEEIIQAKKKIFMDMADSALLGDDFSRYQSSFVHLSDGHIFNLGNLQLETVYAPGLTSGAVCLLCRTVPCLFTGKAIGGGTMQMDIPGALQLFIYRTTLQTLWEKAAPYPNLLILAADAPKPLKAEYLADLFTAVRRIFDGSWKGTAVEGSSSLHLSYGKVKDFRYDPERVRSAAPVPELEAVKDRFRPGTYKKNGEYFDYMLYSPETAENERYPLVLYLHGAGERGDNLRRTLANPGAVSFAAPEWQKEHPCFVLAPQCAENAWWTDDRYMRLLSDAVMKLPASLPVDPNRVYITGLSMGGMGTWKMISEYSRLFAAAMPVCGAGDPFAVRAARAVPVWAFHAENDPVVSCTGKIEVPEFPACYGTGSMVTSLRSAGNKNVRFTKYTAEEMERLGLHGHASWVPAYGNREAKEWMFSFTRENRYDASEVMPGVWHIEDYSQDSFYIVEGRLSALMIDTGLGKGNPVEFAESLTDLPIELAVTHAHPDHFHHAGRFHTFYMSPKDIPMLEEPYMKEYMAEKMTDVPPIRPEAVRPVQEGSIIDLGGGVQIEVFELPGHTPGSVCYVDPVHRCCFCGDVMGVWMQLSGSTTLPEYRRSLIHFRDRMIQKGYQDFRFLGGHLNQEGGEFPYRDTYRPFGMERVSDLIELIDLILSEKIDYFPADVLSTGNPPLLARKGQARIVFHL